MSMRSKICTGVIYWVSIGDESSGDRVATLPRSKGPAKTAIQVLTLERMRGEGVREAGENLERG